MILCSYRTSFWFLSFDEMVTNSHCSAMAHDMNLYFLPSAVQLGESKRKPYCNKKVCVKFIISKKDYVNDTEVLI